MLKKITFDQKKLGDLFDSYPDEVIPRWLSPIGHDAIVWQVHVPFGELISNQSGMRSSLAGKGNVGIILHGEVELFELSSFSDVVAYRPIRILGKGSIFGDFAVLDDYHDFEGPSRRGERWTLVAGRRSMLVAQKLNGKGMSACLGKTRVLKELETNLSAYGDGVSKFEKAAFGCVQLATLIEANIDCNATILLLNLSPANFKSDVFKDVRVGFHELGWKRAKTYRDAVNSFNWHELLEFRSHAVAETHGRSPGKIQSKTTLIPFADAIFDALNRPIRNEPCFQMGLPDWISSANSVLVEHNITPEKVLCAVPDAKTEFYFPIDLHNYFFNCAMALETHGHREKVKKTEGALDAAFPRKGKDDATMHFRRLCDSLITTFKATNTEYPYTVTSTWFDGVTRNMLLLKFLRNDRIE